MYKRGLIHLCGSVVPDYAGTSIRPVWYLERIVFDINSNGVMMMTEIIIHPHGIIPNERGKPQRGRSKN